MNVHLARACLVIALTNTIHLVVTAAILATVESYATKVSSSASSNVHCDIHVNAQRPTCKKDIMNMLAAKR